MKRLFTVLVYFLIIFKLQSQPLSGSQNGPIYGFIPAGSILTANPTSEANSIYTIREQRVVKIARYNSQYWYVETDNVKGYLATSTVKATGRTPQEALANERLTHQTARQTPEYAAESESTNQPAYLREERQSRFVSIDPVVNASNHTAHSYRTHSNPSSRPPAKRSRTYRSSSRRSSYRHSSSSSSSSYYIRGPRGGCYYITASGRKQYVDRSMCN